MLAKEDYSLSKMYKNIQFYVPMQTKFESDNMIKRNKILKYSLWESKKQNVILLSKSLIQIYKLVTFTKDLRSCLSEILRKNLNSERIYKLQQLPFF